jgi:hypothetical protein
MSWFDSNKCQKFFTYNTRKLNIKGISAQLDKLDVHSNIGLGELNIEPQFVLATEKLQELDFLQMQICQQINLLDKKSPLKEQLREEYIKTMMMMFKIAQNPSSVEQDNFNTKENTDTTRQSFTAEVTETKALNQDNITSETEPQPAPADTKKNYIKSLIQQDEIPKALDELGKWAYKNNTYTLLLAQYATINKQMLRGLLKNTEIEYKEYVSRLSDFVDSL